ncbi:MAG: hypothetical protein LBW77_03145 [Verrucomicrobiota bacterium]|jgi:hypothetical protein|nr:hypothetical protein [Verrucomicrobiota bacterium]
MNTLFDRRALTVKPLSERKNKLDIRRDAIDPDAAPPELDATTRTAVRRAADDIRAARARRAPVVLAFGAHSIKNGLSQVMIRLMRGGWVTHFATNGAGVIHDWEFAYQGRSGEDVKRYTAEGQFGLWEETGLYLNWAIAIGAYRGLGYGESVGALVADDGLPVPAPDELRAAVAAGAAEGADEAGLTRAAAAADLLALHRRGGLPAPHAEAGGFLRVPHPFKAYGLQAAAYTAGVPFTAHPMFGHDIIYTHPLNCGAAIGRTAERDFLAFVRSISQLQGGVYLSVGSAVMSPMIFEKALSMSRNLARSRGGAIDDFAIHVVDLAKAAWDWSHDGEPPQDNPAYYLRFCKTFSRMGGRLTYTSSDNRSYLAALLHELETL